MLLMLFTANRSRAAAATLSIEGREIIRGGGSEMIVSIDFN